MIKKLILSLVFVLCISAYCEAGLLANLFGGGRRQSYAPRQSESTVQLDPEEEALNCLQLVNEERVRRHLRPLQFSQDLAEQSVQWSRTMVRSGFRHGAGREIIAMGGSTSSFAFRIWMGSPPHRSMLLSSSYKEVGFGMSNGYWTGRFR